MLAYIVKYALTTGIEVVHGTLVEDKYLSAGKGFYRPSEWCSTARGAITLAENMRARKLGSLNKQIRRIQEIKVRIPDSRLVPIYPGKDLQPGDIVFTPSCEMAEVYNVTMDDGVFTSKGQFCASVLRREKVAADLPIPGEQTVEAEVENANND